MNREHTQLLGRIPLFSRLEAPELSALVSLAQSRQFAARQSVVEQGQPGGDVFAIVSGHLKAVTRAASGKDVLLAIMGPGEIFGEVTLLDGSPRSATVTTLEPSELLVLKREDFLKFLEGSPKVTVKLMEVLARRVRRLSQRSEDLAFLDVSARLAKALCELFDAHGRPDPDGNNRLTLRLSQQELGELVNATRESVNKHLRHWVQQGLIRQDGGELVLLDPRALHSMARFEPWS